MKKRFTLPVLALYLGLLLSSCNSSSSEFIEIPIQFENGFGNLPKGFGMVSGRIPADNPWYKTAIDVTGIPEDWDNPDVDCIWFDGQQFAFQNYKQGNLSEAFYNDLVSSWNINMDKRSFSEQPIKCYVHVVFGKDKDGNLKYKIDTNNNLDFSDEKAYSPSELSYNYSDSLVNSLAQTVTYESLRNGKIVELEAPLLIVTADNALWRNIPQHGVAKVGENRILISSGFQSMNYDPVSIYLDEEKQEIKQNEFIQLGDDIYQNLGVNIDKQLLRLKKIRKDSLIFSSQVGFYAKPFAGNDFVTEQAITLESFKGKFLFLDFWGSWCRPCIVELPELKKAYQNIDRNKVDFLGIAYDQADSFEKILENEKIEWKQILCEKEEGIIDDYNITGYPTSLLIDPKGKIIAKNISANQLVDTLNYYTKLY